MDGIDDASAAATRRTKNGHNAPHGERDMQQMSQEKILETRMKIKKNVYDVEIVTVTVKIHRTIIRVIRGYKPTP